MTELQITIEKTLNEDWDLVKDTAGACSDNHTVFALAFRFGWHAAHKYYKPNEFNEAVDKVNKQ